MKPKIKSQRELELEVENFNLKHKIGDKVKLKIGGTVTKDATTRSEATILGGHSAVVFLEGISGCYSLDCIE